MRRGEIWTAAGGKDYAGKPRPVAMVQDDAFDATDSVIICALTTDPTPAPLFRIPIDPTPRNGLRGPCHLMVDKLTSMPRSKLGRRIGVLTVHDLQRMDEAIVVFLGLGSVGKET